MPYRHVATLLIACGITAGDMRGFAQKPGSPRAADYLAMAGEVEALAAAGLTQRHAGRARGYDMTERSTYVMAAAYLAEGRTPAEVRADESQPVTPARARFLARVADAMAGQLAAGARAN
jgi:hypothetical protein